MPVLGTRVSSINLRCAEAFELIDKNGDGRLTRIEVIQACKHDPRVRELLRLPETIRQEDGSREAFEQVFQRMDKDDSKSVDLEEFMAFWKEEVSRAAAHRSASKLTFRACRAHSGLALPLG